MWPHHCCKHRECWYWNPKVWLSPCSCTLGSWQLAQAGTCAVQSSAWSVQSLPVTLREHLRQAEMEMLRVTDLLWLWEATLNWKLDGSISHGTLAQDCPALITMFSGEFRFRHRTVPTMPLLKCQRWSASSWSGEWERENCPAAGPPALRMISGRWLGDMLACCSHTSHLFYT